MSEKNVHQLQWKQKNTQDQSINYAPRNVDNHQQGTPIGLHHHQSSSSAAAAISDSSSAAQSNHPLSLSSAINSSSSSSSSSNGRFPIIVSAGHQHQIINSPPVTVLATPTTPTTPIGLQQHFHQMQHLQQQQQQQQQQHLHQQQQQQQHHHHHQQQDQHIFQHSQQNPHFEITKIMSLNSGALSRLDLTPALGNHPVPSAITENVLSLIGMTASGSGGSANNANRNINSVKIPDEEKLRKVQAVVESGIGDHAKQQILQILDRISTLKPVERLLLYLRMPGESPDSDPLRQPQNPLGTRSEINHTINWVRSHLEHDPKVSIPKQDVYNDYIAYCERLDIKPLSTADFGKVMKQVFPEIRPRRLGTRGHSRYCYAAMRKTTKLIPPQLPMLGGAKQTADNSSTETECDTSTDSWNTVRNWAEGLFSMKFDNMKDLADHIKNNEYAGSGIGGGVTGSSRVLMQKKLQQRDVKEKRVNADSGPLKKRRKKKRKGSTSSESSTTQNPSSVGSINEPPSKSNDDVLLSALAIKQEIPDSPNSSQTNRRQQQMHFQHSPAAFDNNPIIGQQLLPMNLATESERGKNMAAQLPVPSSSSVAKNLTKTIVELPPSVSLLPIDPQLSSVKEEIINDDYNPQNVICKKVRRAHLTKGILATSNTPLTTIGGGGGGAIETQTSSQSIEATPTSSTNYSMGPPAQITTTAMESAKIASQLRARKLRLLQAHPEMYSTYEQHQQQQLLSQQQPTALVDNVEITEDKEGVLPENLGLPRERVISICNMDKHELDDYLNTNDEDNSQDQEAELLQYFQTGDAENNNNNNTNKQTTSLQLQQQQQQQLLQQQQNIDANNPSLAVINNNNSAFEAPSKKKSSSAMSAGNCGNSLTKDREDITQLRNYLHQNFNKDSNETIGVNATTTAAANQRGNFQAQKFNTNGNHCILPGIFNEGSASASLVIMSQKHLNETTSQPRDIAITAAAVSSSATSFPTTPMAISTAISRNQTMGNISTVTNASNTPRSTQKRKINLNAMVPAPSTTQRRKNCTFFPISPNINLSNNKTNNNNNTLVSLSSSSSTTTNSTTFFASPRLTAPIGRTKPVLHKQHSLPTHVDKNTILSSAINNPMIGSSRNNRSFNTMTSASAPPSPSILQDTNNLFGGKSSITSACSSSNSASGAYNLLLSTQDYSQGFDSSSCATMHDQNSLECVLDEPPPHLLAESRSRSVPLQYRNSPAFNQTSNYAGFSSTCSSAAQTPVPPQFADFNDHSSILDIFSDASQSHGQTSIKLEESNNSLLCSSINDILPPDYGRIGNNNFGGIVSRSVPSTPVPLNNILDPFLSGGRKHLHQQQQLHDSFPSAQSKYSTKMYDISKSMPTTPITSNTATPSFRYSPELNRDFLINGNTVESTTAYNSRAPSVAAVNGLSDSLLDDGREGGSNSLTDGMDDLTSFGEVSESIMEADILNMNNL